MTVCHNITISTHYETVYIAKLVAFLSSAMVQLCDTQVPSSNTAGSFVFMVCDKFLKVDPPPQKKPFSSRMLEFHIPKESREIWAYFIKIVFSK